MNEAELIELLNELVKQPNESEWVYHFGHRFLFDGYLIANGNAQLKAMIM
jgi:hypothetical protein